MKVCVLTLGCKVNKYESDSLLNIFKKQGCEITESLEKADVYVVNTCAVTGEAEKKSRQMLAKCKKLNANAKIYVCGCAAQHNWQQFLGKAALIKGVSGKNKIASLEEGVRLDNVPKQYEQEEFALQTRTRAYIKVQDGCDNFCSYCIIPYLRGRSRSRDVNSIIDEVKNLGSDIKEIVLTGINLSDFKIDGKLGLLPLLEELDKFNLRMRLSSMEEVIADEEFIKGLSRLKNFCPHFHLSLQSGCDSVLKRMNRRYTAAEFKNTCQLIRKYFPSASITTDVIVGFPGESEEEFNQTKQFIERVAFSGLHIFPYSHREGTVASKQKDLNFQIKKARAEQLKELDKTLRGRFIEQNKSGKVLIEEIENGKSYGFTENYIKCEIDAVCKVGDIVEVNIIGTDGQLAKANLV